MGNDISSSQNVTSAVKQCSYKFPLDDVSYDLEDSLIVKYLATLMFIDRHGGLDPGFFIWSMRDRTPYIDSFTASIEYDTGIFYRIIVSLKGPLSYFVSPTKTIPPDRKLIESILFRIIQRRSKYIRIKQEFIAKLNVYAPSSDIQFVDKIWDIIWNRLTHDQLTSMNTKTMWNVKGETMSFGGLVTDKHIFKFCHSVPVELYLTNRDHIVYNLYYWDRTKEKEECERHITNWIKRANTTYINKHIWDYWMLEREEYNSYVQWLPREILEDVVSLI